MYAMKPVTISEKSSVSTALPSFSLSSMVMGWRLTLYGARQMEHSSSDDGFALIHSSRHSLCAGMFSNVSALEQPLCVVIMQ